MAEIVALGCGLVGEYVINELIDDGHDLTVIGLEIPNSLEGRCKTIKSDALKYVETIKNKYFYIQFGPGPKNTQTNRKSSSSYFWKRIM